MNLVFDPGIAYPASFIEATFTKIIPYTEKVLTLRGESEIDQT